MHKSRLSTFVIDCQGQDLEAATEFWSAALGRRVRPPEPDSPKYRELVTDEDEAMVLLQAVDHASRIHLDIEADDIEAEVARLETLGAKRVSKIHTWWVMEAPTGHRFCVVRPQRKKGLEAEGNRWPDGGGKK